MHTTVLKNIFEETRDPIDNSKLNEDYRYLKQLLNTIVMKNFLKALIIRERTMDEY